MCIYIYILGMKCQFLILEFGFVVFGCWYFDFIIMSRDRVGMFSFGIGGQHGGKSFIMKLYQSSSQN